MPSDSEVLVSGIWVEMKVYHQSGVVLWGGIKVEKVEKVGFVVHRVCVFLRNGAGVRLSRYGRVGRM